MTNTPAAADVAPQEPNTEGMWECPECDRTFSRRHGVVRHLNETHGYTPTSLPKRVPGPVRAGTAAEAPQSTRVAEVRKQLRDLTTPLKQQHAAINRQLEALGREQVALREARSDIEAVLRKLDPSSVKPKQHEGVHTDAEKVAAVRTFVAEHAGELADGFTVESLYRMMRAANAGPPQSPAKVRDAIELLRDEGFVRADKIVRGGYPQFLIVSNGGVTDDAA